MYVHRLEDSVLSRCQFFPTWFVDSMQYQSKLQCYIVDINKLSLKFIFRDKRSRLFEIILKENKTGGLTLPDLKTYHKTLVIKTVWFCQNN